jgi:hypothetical protein
LAISVNIRRLLFLLCLCICPAISAQQLSRQVTVSAAGVSSAGNYILSQTVGEAVVEIFNSQDLILTQGFQQPSTKDYYVLGNITENIIVYPNPVSDILKVRLGGSVSRDYIISIVNVTGITVISNSQSVIQGDIMDMEIPVGNLYDGIYFVSIRSVDNIVNLIFKIEKI